MRALVLMLIPVIALSVSVGDILEKWKSSEYVANRFFVEESKFPKMRYEKVYKKGEDKLVFVLNPKKLVWFREAGECWMGEDILYYVPSGINDLEDVAMEALESASDATIVEGDGWYLLQYETEKGYFEVEIDDLGIPSRIYRRIDGVEMKMTIEPLLEDVGDLEELLEGRELSDEPAFPEEIGEIMRIFDWFTVLGSDGNLEIVGIINGEWHKVKVGFKEFEGSVKFGSVYIEGDKRVMKILEGRSR